MHAQGRKTNELLGYTSGVITFARRDDITLTDADQMHLSPIVKTNASSQGCKCINPLARSMAGLTDKGTCLARRPQGIDGSSGLWQTQSFPIPLSLHHQHRHFEQGAKSRARGSPSQETPSRDPLACSTLPFSSTLRPTLDSLVSISQSIHTYQTVNT